MKYIKSFCRIGLVIVPTPFMLHAQSTILKSIYNGAPGSNGGHSGGNGPWGRGRNGRDGN